MTLPAITPREIPRLAAILLQAADAGTPPPPLGEQYPELGLREAARIRDVVLAARLARGERVLGAHAWESPRGWQWGWVTDAALVAGDIRSAAEGVAVRRDEGRTGWAAQLGRQAETSRCEVDDLLHGCLPPRIAVTDGRAAIGRRAATGLGWLVGQLAEVDVPAPPDIWLVIHRL